MTVPALSLVAVIAILLAGTSFWIIYKYDRNRFYDHLARTMTQTAIGVASVAMAVWLFTQQSQLQNGRQFSQQANVTAAVLRSVIVAVTLDTKGLLDLNNMAYFLDCDKISQCDTDPRSRRTFDYQLRVLRNFLGRTEDQRPIFELADGYSEQVRDAMKTSYVLGPRVIENLLTTAQSYSNSIRRTRNLLNKQFLDVQVLLSHLEIPPREASDAFLKIAAIQAENVSDAAQFVCALDTIERLLTSTKSLEGADQLADVPLGNNDFSMCDINGGEAFGPYLRWNKSFRKAQN